MKAKIFSRGRITIPWAIRRRLGLTPGTKLLFAETSDHLKAVKVMDKARPKKRIRRSQ